MVGVSSAFLVSVVLLICGEVFPAHSSDVNWGKKVNCFVVHETVVCPGCNYRAGLSCPRALKDSQNCLQPTEPLPVFKKPTIPPYDADVPSLPDDIDANSVMKTRHKQIAIKNTNITQIDYNSTPKTKEIQKEPTQKINMNIYLYRILGHRFPKYRYKRGIEKKEEMKKNEWTKQIEEMEQDEERKKDEVMKEDEEMEKDEARKQDEEIEKDEVMKQGEEEAKVEEIQQMEEPEHEICNWNGDCPCPLICCRTGPGCPKRCVMGIRLPPPWG